MDNTAMNQTHHMKPIAAGLASLGRGGDSMLVHMQPREVAGLQRLAMAHGGSLTVNPETGLPEAGFLGDVLGAIAPIALGFALGPAGLGLSSLQAGLATGLLGWAATGDLGKGIGAGLGAAGGAGLGGALGEFGGVPAVSKVAEPALLGAAETAPTALASQATPLLSQAGSLTPSALTSAVPNLTNVGTSFVPTATQAAGAALAESVPGAIVPNVGAGISKAFANPLEFAKAYPTAAFTAASPLLAGALTPPQTTFPTVQEEKSNYEGPYYPTQRDARFPTQEERQQLGTKEYQYFNPVHPYPGFENYDPNYRGYAEGGDVNETPDPDSNPAEYQSGQYGAPLLNKSVGGLASFADGGSTAEVNYNLSKPSGSFQDPNSIPSTAFQTELDAYNKKGSDSMGGGWVTDFYGNKRYVDGPINVVHRSDALQTTLDRINSSPNPLLGIFGGFFNSGLTQAQAEAKAGPKPVWNPPTPSAPMQGPTTAYTGSGITALPQRQPTQNLNLAQGFSDMSKDILNSGPMYAKGGYLDGPGDGMSDSIPATIADKQPARLADGEFVVPADVVSHLGNGSTKAGAQRLYAMMDKVRKARTGTTKQGKQINPNKYMPA